MVDNNWRRRHSKCFVVLDSPNPEEAFLLYVGMSFHAARDKARQRGLLALYRKNGQNLEFIKFLTGDEKEERKYG